MLVEETKVKIFTAFVSLIYRWKVWGNGDKRRRSKLWMRLFASTSGSVTIYDVINRMRHSVVMPLMQERFQ